MRNILVLVVLSILGIITASVAVANNPPGRDPCGHGATNKPCRPDPSTNGKDCEHHGNQGGVNEDHCLGTTAAPPTTTTGGTPSTTTTSTAPTIPPTTSTPLPPATVSTSMTSTTSTGVSTTTGTTTTNTPSIIGKPPTQRHPKTKTPTKPSRPTSTPTRPTKPQIPSCPTGDVLFKFNGKWHCGVPGKG